VQLRIPRWQVRLRQPPRSAMGWHERLSRHHDAARPRLLPLGSRPAEQQHEPEKGRFRRMPAIRWSSERWWACQSRRRTDDPGSCVDGLVFLVLPIRGVSGVGALILATTTGQRCNVASKKAVGRAYTKALRTKSKQRRPTAFLLHPQQRGGGRAEGRAGALLLLLRRRTVAPTTVGVVRGAVPVPEERRDDSSSGNDSRSGPAFRAPGSSRSPS
jgi:hypothetical protein